MMESYPSTQTTSRSSVKRCINIDWLEVHAREPWAQPRNAAYYSAHGFVVHERLYGTRVYLEMFTLEGSDGEPLLEVRRNPASQGLNGIHDPNECHIRLVNRTCYFDNAALFLDTFLKSNGYTEVRISRIDLCLDFVMFDKGDDPQAFVRRFFRHKYAKINQGRISAHGDDQWTGMEWNSLSWGSKTSAVGTKMYNKTLELYDVKTDSFGKPYIRQAWQLCDMIDDWQRVTKDGKRVNVWRVEFSLRSAVKNWIPIELDGVPHKWQSLQNNLQVYYNRSQMLVMFASLSQHYFHFKKYKAGQRKDRCKDKVLFDFSGTQVTYKIGRPDYAAGSGNSTRKRYARLIAKIKEYQQMHPGPELWKACEVLINSMTEDEVRSDMANPWSREELLYLRTLMSYATRHKELSVDVCMREVKELLKITDRTIDIF